MTAPLPADAFVPVPIRWRHAAAGDVFVGRDDRLWLVRQQLDHSSGRVEVVCDGGEGLIGQPDPDEVVHVLVPVTERDAVELCIDELGARLIAGRTT